MPQPSINKACYATVAPGNNNWDEFAQNLSTKLPPQQNVTMNINMNMYPNVMNINFAGYGNGNQQSNQLPQQQLNCVKPGSPPITLEVTEKKQDTEGKSWVD